MKKTFAICLSLILMLGTLSACKTPSEDNSAADAPAFGTVVSVFPVYDWVKNILGSNPGNVGLTLLLDSGVDLHSYSPSVSDVKKIADADLFIYVGGPSDKWVEDALAEAKEGQTVVNLFDVLRDEGRLLKTGGRDDEHIWLSLKNAVCCVKAAADALAAVDPENAEYYRKNAADYIGKLKALDKQYEEAASSENRKPLLFGDRFPFAYLTNDCGLEYYAAYTGCSAETEVGFETVKELSKKIDELGLSYVLTIDGSDGKLAETVIQNTEKRDQKTLMLNSMQSVKKEDIEAGTSYLSIMQDNLDVLIEALK